MTWGGRRRRAAVRESSSAVGSTSGISVVASSSSSKRATFSSSQPTSSSAPHPSTVSIPSSASSSHSIFSSNSPASSIVSSSTHFSSSASGQSTSTPAGILQTHTHTTSSQSLSSSSTSESASASSTVKTSAVSSSAAVKDTSSHFTPSKSFSTPQVSLTTFVTFPDTVTSSRESSKTFSIISLTSAAPDRTPPLSPAPAGPNSFAEAPAPPRISTVPFVPAGSTAAGTISHVAAPTPTDAVFSLPSAAPTSDIGSASASATGGPTANNANASASAASAAAKKHTAAVAGGVIAVLLVLIAIGAAFLVRRNRHRRARAQWAFSSYHGGNGPAAAGTFAEGHGHGRGGSLGDVEAAPGAYFFGGHSAAGSGNLVRPSMEQIVVGASASHVPVTYGATTQPSHALSSSLGSNSLTSGSPLKTGGAAAGYLGPFAAPAFPKSVAEQHRHDGERTASGYSVWSDPFRGPMEGPIITTTAPSGHTHSNSAPTAAAGLGVAGLATAATPGQRDSVMSAASSFYSTLSASPAQNFVVPDPEADALAQSQPRLVPTIPALKYTPATPSPSRAKHGNQGSTSTVGSVSTYSEGVPSFQGYAKGWGLTIDSSHGGSGANGHNSVLKTPGDEVDPFMRAEEVALGRASAI